MKNIVAFFALFAAFLAPSISFAGEHVSYKCNVNLQDPQTNTFWYYSLEGTAILSQGEFTGFESNPVLTVSKSLSSENPSDVTKVFIFGEEVAQKGFFHKGTHPALLLSLARSVLGLNLTLDATTNEIFVSHTVEMGHSLNSKSGTVCVKEEIHE